MHTSTYGIRIRNLYILNIRFHVLPNETGKFVLYAVSNNI